MNIQFVCGKPGTLETELSGSTETVLCDYAVGFYL